MKKEKVVKATPTKKATTKKVSLKKEENSLPPIKFSIVTEGEDVKITLDGSREVLTEIIFAGMLEDDKFRGIILESTTKYMSFKLENALRKQISSVKAPKSTTKKAKSEKNKNK